MRGGWQFATVLWLLVAIVASACDLAGADRSSSRSAAPTATPDPTVAGALTLKPEQVILPAEQFPLAGYSVDTDEPAGTNRWTRVWSGPDAFSWVRVYVTVLGPSASARDSIAATTCDWTFTPPAQRGAEIVAPVVGDGAKACGYDFTNLAVGSLVYTTGTRNVIVTVGVYRRSASQAAAAAFVASLADYQLWIIDKVAPVPGVVLRSAPLVQLPSAADVGTQQPSRTTPPTNTGTPAPTAARVAAVDVNPKSIDFGPHGGCDGGSILQQRFDVTAPSDVSWSVDWSGSSFVSWAHGSLDRTSGTGVGSVTWTVTIAAQKHSTSGFTCNDFYRFAYGDTITFSFSRGGSTFGQISTRASYTYLALY